MWTEAIPLEMNRDLLVLKELLDEIEHVELREEIYLAVAKLLRTLVEEGTHF